MILSNTLLLAKLKLSLFHNEREKNRKNNNNLILSYLYNLVIHMISQNNLVITIKYFENYYDKTKVKM